MSQVIDLETAADHIVQASKDANGTSRSPFFFITGAGISHPVVPLASDIVEACKHAAYARNRTAEPPTNQPIDVYSHWFQQAYPQPAQRQRYLQSLIEDKPVSPANFRLAHLLLCRGITGLVVTTNFDDFLSRALTLFGQPHIVCDHPATTERINPERDGIQIVHVHGSYWFYDCCNLRDEIAQRSRPSMSSAQTMSALLDRILVHRSPLVIGYSGWEGDVVMSALKRRLLTSLPYNLYWFCHKRDTIDDMPPELRNHPQVMFVLPPAFGAKPDAEESPLGPSDILQLQGRSDSTKETIPGALTETKGTTLSAQQVFDTLIRTVGCDEPPLTADPLSFFAAHIRRSLLSPDTPSPEPDVYFLQSVVERIERAMAVEAEVSREVQSQLGSVRSAIRRSQYTEAILAASQIRLADLTPTELHELFDAALSAASGLLAQSSDEALAASDLIVRIGDTPALAAEDSLEVREHLARALVNKGVDLHELGRRQEAIATYDQVVERYGDASEPSLREEVVMALVNKGVLATSLGTTTEAERAFSAALEYVSLSDSVGSRLCAATAMIGLGRPDDARECIYAIDASQVDQSEVRSFFTDLASIASSPIPPPGIDEFLTDAKKHLESQTDSKELK